MKLVFALLIAVSCFGQTVTELQVPRIGTNCFDVTWTVAGLGGNVTTLFEGGETTTMVQSRSMSGGNGDYTFPWCYPEADSDYFFQFTVDATLVQCPAVCTDCDSGDDALFPAGGSNIDCDNIGDPFKVHTDVAPGNTDPVAPVHAVTDPYAEITGTTTNTTCANLVTDFNTVRTAGGTQILAVDISGGIECLGTSFTFTGATNRVVIQPDIDPSLFTKPFAQISGDDPNILWLLPSDPPRLERASAGGEFVSVGPLVTFRNVKFGYDPEPYAPTQLAVSAVTLGTGIITLTNPCPTGLTVNSAVWLNLPGVTTYPGVANVTSCVGSTLTLTSVTFSGGAYSGGGTVTWGSNIPVSGATNGASTRLTVPNHGLSIAGGGKNYVYVYVSGALGGEINGTHDFTVIDANTIELTGIVSSQAYTASTVDFVFYDSGIRISMVTLSGDNVRFLQCIFGTPWYGQYKSRTMIGGSTDGLIIRDSYQVGAFNAATVDLPGTNLPANVGSNAAFAANFFGGDGSTDLQIINNTFIDCNGICFDFQSNIGVPQNVTISGNHFRMSDRLGIDVLGTDFTASLGRWSQARHIIELKAGCIQCAITGNYLSGQGFDAAAPQGYGIFVNNGNATGFSPTGQVQSLLINWNFIERVGVCLGNAWSSPAVNQETTFASRIEFSDNFCNQNWQQQRIAPGSSGSTAKATGAFFGIQGSSLGAAEFLKWSRNTYWSCQGTACGVFGGQGGFFPECEVEDNIFTWHTGGGVNGIFDYGAGVDPIVTATYQTIFDSFCVRGSFQNNYILGGVTNPQNVSGLKNSTTPGDNVTAAACTASWPTSGSFSGLTCLGQTGGTSYQDRHNTVFPSGSYFSAFGGVGPQDTMLDMLGVVRNLTVLQTTAAGVTPATVIFNWRANTTTGCRVVITDDDKATVTAATASSGSTTQTVTFNALTALTAYRAWVECENGKPEYWAKTLN